MHIFFLLFIVIDHNVVEKNSKQQNKDILTKQKRISGGYVRNDDCFKRNGRWKQIINKTTLCLKKRANFGSTDKC